MIDPGIIGATLLFLGGTILLILLGGENGASPKKAKAKKGTRRSKSKLAKRLRNTYGVPKRSQINRSKNGTTKANRSSRKLEKK